MSRVEKEIEEALARDWRGALVVYYRQRYALWIILAGLIVAAAFTHANHGEMAVFFGVCAVYAVAVGVRVGALCAATFAARFAARRFGWVGYETTGDQAWEMAELATLFLLVVWKSDGVHQLRLRERANGG